jgi:transposase, IS30 family
MRYTHFSKTERLEISVLLKRGYSAREIGSALGKHHSSVSREIKRNSVKGRYDPLKADHKAYVKRYWAKYQGMKVRTTSGLEDYVWEKMHPPFHWSPEQIAGRWTKETGIRLKTDTVYKYLYHNSYGNYLCRYLKYKRYRRKKRKQKKSARELIPNRVWIDLRPAAANLRARFGDFEGDTMGKSRQASRQTMVVTRERKSRKMFAVKVPRLKYAMDGFKKLLSPYQDIVTSLTLDNGVENVRHQELRIDTYFCHPYSSWEKGSVEQGIGLIRDYIPKKADLKDYANRDIAAIIKTINNKPMKCLNWSTPNEVFEEHYRQAILQSTNPLTSAVCCT